MKETKTSYLNIAIILTGLTILSFWIEGLRILLLSNSYISVFNYLLDAFGFLTWCCELLILRSLISQKAIRTSILMLTVFALLYTIPMTLYQFINLRSIAPIMPLAFLTFIGSYILLGILILANPDRKKPVLKLLRSFGLLVIIITSVNFSAFIIITVTTYVFHYNVMRFTGISTITSTIPTIFLLRFFIQLKNIDKDSEIPTPRNETNWPPPSTV